MNFKSVSNNVMKNVNDVTDKVKDLGHDAKGTVKKAVKVAKDAGHNIEGFIKHHK
ncbi:MAG: hypothetical protein ACRCXA_05330 [Peptostreptococcaceae bacterium]